MDYHEVFLNKFKNTGLDFMDILLVKAYLSLFSPFSQQLPMTSRPKKLLVNRKCLWEKHMCLGAVVRKSI